MSCPVSVAEHVALRLGRWDGAAEALKPSYETSTERIFRPRWSNWVFCGKTDSKLNLARKQGGLKQIRTLDLSDNDIYDLRAVLIAITPLHSLRGLSLEGNPCSMCQSYKNVTLKYLPLLEYLDNTEILAEDRPEENCNENCTDAAVVFTCHRIIGLPPPPKEKGILQTFHLEVSLPLLEKIKIDSPVSEDPKLEEKKLKSGEDKKKKSHKMLKGFNPYVAQDERDAKIKDTSFKTTRQPWSKLIQFPEDTLVVQSPHHDLKDIRDTFRSCVDVKVVYLKILPALRVKKNSKKKKKESKIKSSTHDLKVQEEIEPKETILKKITLTRFSCDLRSVNWSDRTVDYYWADHPKSSPKAAIVDGDLRTLKYVEGKAKPSKDKKRGKFSEDESKLKKASSKVTLPTMFTCQVGFGLRRL